MSTDPLALVEELDRATARLFETAGQLDSIIAPSLLPGWSRGHVLTHIARNADAFTNLFTWARTGIVTPAYPSPEARVAGIEAGAGRPLAEQLADLHESHERLTAAMDAMSAEDWTVELPLPTGPQRAARYPWRRLREVEMHHVDLGVGYQPADWPDSFAHRLLHEVATGLSGIDLTLDPVGMGHPVPVGAGGDPTVSGTPAALAAWLTGRAGGADLDVKPHGDLPTVPSWM